MTRVACSYCGHMSRDVQHDDNRDAPLIAASLGWTIKHYGPVTLLRDPHCVEARD